MKHMNGGWKRVWIPLAILILITGIMLVTTQVLLPKHKHDKALALMEAGIYEDAYELLMQLGDEAAVTRSINERADNLLAMGEDEAAYALLAGQTDAESQNKRMGIKQKQIANIKVGYSFSLGSCEQDNNLENGTESIKWLVLCKTDDRVLAVSRYVLDCRLFDEESKAVSWKDCDLRAWLNGYFFETAFSPDEQALILTTLVSADNNPEYSTDPGEVTEDKVFLLSIPEVQQYFPDDESRICKPTAYAKARSDYTYPDPNTCCWWLRTPGIGPSCAARVYSFGSFDYMGSIANCTNTVVRPGVRPAVWIDLNEIS